MTRPVLLGLLVALFGIGCKKEEGKPKAPPPDAAVKALVRMTLDSVTEPASVSMGKTYAPEAGQKWVLVKATVRFVECTDEPPAGAGYPPGKIAIFRAENGVLSDGKGGRFPAAGSGMGDEARPGAFAVTEMSCEAAMGAGEPAVFLFSVPSTTDVKTLTLWYRGGSLSLGS